MPGQRLPLREDVAQCEGAQHVPQGGGGQQPGGSTVVINIGYRVDGVSHLVVHDGVDEHSDTVFGKDLREII